MKKEVISYQTKKRLSEALKAAMAKKRFESITVTELLEACVSALVDLLEGGMRQSLEEMIALYDIAMRGAVREALLKSSESAAGMG